MCNYQPKIKILSAILMTAALSACGGSSDKRANIDLGGSSSSTTSSSSSSSSSTSSVPGTSWLPLIETFDADSAQEFFSQEYQSLENVDPRDTGDTWPAFYFPTSGLPENRLIVRDNKITFGNARFSIGQGYYHDAEYDETNVFNNRKNQSTEGANVTWGELDLSKNYKVSFCVVANNDTGRFELYVDNNSSNADRSIWGSPSRLVSLGTANLTAGQRFQINVPGSVTNSASIAARIGGATSFLQFRADSTAQVTISDLWIGYQDDTATEPTACAAGDHLTLSPPSTAPNAPSITAGDSQLGITWSAVAGATGYDVSWNTTNTPPTETSQIQNASGLAHTITNLTNDTLYYVFVRAKNSSGASGWSQATEGTPVAAVVVPDAPVGLTSTAGNTQVDISWTVDTAAAAYQVAYSTTATPPASESADWVSPSGEGSHTFSLSLIHI